MWVAPDLPSVDDMTDVLASTPRTGSSTRLHSLDALRAGALLLGIVLHSLLPFVPGLPWLVNDTRSSWAAGVPVQVVHTFRMVLFMVLAGYFGALVLRRRGPGRYLRDRALRVLAPLVVFWPPAVLSLGALALLNARVNDVPLVVPPAPDGPPLLMINPGQLWFLLVLMECVLVVLALRGLAVALLGRERTGRLVAAAGRLLSAPGGVVVAAVPYAACLLLQGSALGGIRAPSTLVPSAPALTAYLGAFVVGWALHARADSLARIGRSWPVHLGAALLLALVGLGQSRPEPTASLPLVAAVTALTGWCFAYGLLGLSVRVLAGERPAVRYFADASYWMYLVHLPLLVGVEIALVGLGWPIAVKLALTWLVVGAALVLSYHLLVRSTWVGQWLNGRRHPFRVPWSRGGAR